MNRTPLVSIIIPAYNCENYITNALDSIFEQSYSNIEVIVVNDGSRDSTLEVLKKYPKPIIIINQSNSGSAVARSVGMAKASGEYIAFLDGDDLWLPSKLKKQVKFLEENKNYGLVFSNWVTWKANEDGDFIKRDFSQLYSDIVVKQPLSGWLYKDLLRDCVVWTSCVLMRHSIYNQIGDFNSSLRRGQDYDYWIRVSRITKIHKLDEIHAVYRIHDESISNKTNVVNYEYVIVKNALKNWGFVCSSGINIKPKMVYHRLSDLCFTFSYQHFHNGSSKIALASILTSLRYNPFRIKSWLYLGMILIKRLKDIFFSNRRKL